MTKFKKAIIPESEIELTRKSFLDKGFDKDQVEDLLRREPREVWINDLYQVVSEMDTGRNGWPDMIHLSIKRRDRKPIHDWRELQEIKNQLVGFENEGVELYPAESRLVDVANQFHLYVLMDGKNRFPFGFSERLVGDIPIGKSKQRPRFNMDVK